MLSRSPGSVLWRGSGEKAARTRMARGLECERSWVEEKEGVVEVRESAEPAYIAKQA